MKTDDDGVDLSFQKIHPFKIGRDPFVFAWAGLVSSNSFSLADATKRAIAGLSVTADSYEGLVHIIREVHAEIESSGFVKNFYPNAPDENDLGRVLISGYEGATPCNVVVEFNGKERKYPTSVGCPEFWMVNGPRSVLKDHPDIGSEAGRKTVDQTTKLVRGFLQVCCDRQSTSPDCSLIGGDIHIACLRPGSFEWKVPPKNST